MRTSGVTRASELFDSKARGACTDSYAACILCEKSICDTRPGEWPTLHCRCEVHRTAGVYEKVFGKLLPELVTGAINCALSLRCGGSMAKFRRCLAEEVASRFVVLKGRPSQDAIMHKKALLRLFVSHGTGLAMRQMLLVLCPNGDWRSDKVEFYQQPGPLALPNDAACLEHVVAGLMTALCSAQPEIYPRHRWTGADLAVDSLGVFEACHRLLSTKYIRFAASYEPASRARTLLSGVLPGGSAADAEDNTSGDRNEYDACDLAMVPMPPQESATTMGDNLLAPSGGPIGHRSTAPSAGKRRLGFCRNRSDTSSWPA